MTENDYKEECRNSLAWLRVSATRVVCVAIPFVLLPSSVYAQSGVRSVIIDTRQESSGSADRRIRVIRGWERNPDYKPGGNSPEWIAQWGWETVEDNKVNGNNEAPVTKTCKEAKAFLSNNERIRNTYQNVEEMSCRAAKTAARARGWKPSMEQIADAMEEFNQWLLETMLTDRVFGLPALTQEMEERMRAAASALRDAAVRALVQNDLDQWNAMNDLANATDEQIDLLNQARYHAQARAKSMQGRSDELNPIDQVLGDVLQTYQQSESNGQAVDEVEVSVPGTATSRESAEREHILDQIFGDVSRRPSTGGSESHDASLDWWSGGKETISVDGDGSSREPRSQFLQGTSPISMVAEDHESSKVLDQSIRPSLDDLPTLETDEYLEQASTVTDAVGDFIRGLLPSSAPKRKALKTLDEVELATDGVAKATDAETGAFHWSVFEPLFKMIRDAINADLNGVPRESERLKALPE